MASPLTTFSLLLMSFNPPSTALVKRACDSCHRRKVKCIGESSAPCKNCVSASLVCTYNAIPQKKGPKGSRAKVLSQLRENQRNAQPIANIPADPIYGGRPPSSIYLRTQGLLPPGFIESCLEFYFEHVYSSEPVLHQQKAQEAVLNMERSTEAYCMITAMCAYVLIKANMKVPSSPPLQPDPARVSNVISGHVLLEESLRVRNSYDYHERPTHLTVLTSWFYWGIFFNLAKENTAWSYIREATTQAQLLGIHDEDLYKQDVVDLTRKRVLFWQLFIAERTYALHKHRPISLHPTVRTPTLENLPSERAIIVGLDIMISMFKVIDDTFISLWNRVHSHNSPAWIMQIHLQLTEAVPTYLECTESQAILIRITQQWLRVQVWQLSVLKGFVSSVSNDLPLTFQYPIEIARDLLTMTHQFSHTVMETHGASLAEKLYDIACCMIDVVACTVSTRDTFALGPRDYISGFLTLISTLRRGQTRYFPLLKTKLSEVLPHLPLSQTLHFSHSEPNSPIGTTISGGTSDTGDKISSLSAMTAPSCPSHDLIRRLAVQTGAQLPLITQSSLGLVPTTHVENLSLHNTGSTAQLSISDCLNSSNTPEPYETAIALPHGQLVGRSGMQGHRVGVDPAPYDPQYNVLGYHVDHNMM